MPDIDPDCLIELMPVTPAYLDHLRKTDVRGVPVCYDAERLAVAIWPQLGPGMTIRLFMEVSEESSLQFRWFEPQDPKSFDVKQKAASFRERMAAKLRRFW